MIPVLLDFLLWLGPRFSVAPLFGELATLYAQMGSSGDVTPELGQMIQQFSTTIREMGTGSNLLGGLVSSTLLHVPSLPATPPPIVASLVIPINSPLEAVVWWTVFSLIGLLVGVIYLSLLARRLPIGGLAGAEPVHVAAGILRHWLQVIGFVFLVAVMLLIIYLPVSFLVGLLMLASPAIGSTVAAMAGGLTLILFFYLYFVTAALIMDNAPLSVAVIRSLRLVQDNFWATLGFIVLSNVIGLGFALLLTQLAAVGPWGAVAAIVLNAYIGTGLAMALLVFYRTRFIRGEPQPSLV